ncbi:MAG: histidine kinase [Rhodobacterales bacterium]|nr:MAG: histidine kinase [Rhodobacterales bacterium]
MLVQQILQSKEGITGVLTLKPGDLVSEAARIMSEKRIGTIVVSESGETADGILSERDIVRELGKAGPGCMSNCVRDLMTANPTTTTPEASGEEVLTIMTEGRFRHLPVVEGGKMLGLISIGDVVKARLAELAMERDALEGMIRGN